MKIDVMASASGRGRINREDSSAIEEELAIQAEENEMHSDAGESESDHHNTRTTKPVPSRIALSFDMERISVEDDPMLNGGGYYPLMGLPWEPSVEQPEISGSSTDPTPCPEDDWQHLRGEVANLIKQQEEIHLVLEQIQEQNTQAQDHQYDYQGLHDRHETSVNAILTFLATFEGLRHDLNEATWGGKSYT